MILRYFPTTTSFIESAVSSGGLVVVNCVMGWSRSASVVAAYLIMKHKMKATKVRENKIQTDVIIVKVPVQIGPFGFGTGIGTRACQ